MPLSGTSRFSRDEISDARIGLDQRGETRFEDAHSPAQTSRDPRSIDGLDAGRETDAFEVAATPVQRTLCLIAPDDLSWSAVRHLLRAMPEVQLAGDATRDSEVLNFQTSQIPDAIISAPTLSQGSTLPLLQQLRARWPRTRIVVLVDQYGCKDLDSYAKLPQSSCLWWQDLTPRALKRCLLAVLDAPIRIFSGATFEHEPNAEKCASSQAPDGVQLPPQARSVLIGLAQGLTQQQVATREGIGLRTVKRIVAALEARLGASSLFTLALNAERLGLLQDQTQALSCQGDGAKGTAGSANCANAPTSST